MTTVQDIIKATTPEEHKRIVSDLDDALDIIAHLTGNISYAALFNLTCAVIEALQGKRL